MELVTAMAVASTLLAVAVPSFSLLLAAHNVRMVSIDLYTALVLARNEAIKRNATVTLRPKGGDWAAGWEIVTPDNDILSDHPAISDMAVATVPDGLGMVQFARSGRVSGAAPPAFSLSADGFPALDQRCIQLDLSGRARIEKKPAC